MLTKVCSARYVDASPDWAKQLEADLPAGKTTVTFVARSPVSDESATCSFTVEVRGGWLGMAWTLQRRVELSGMNSAVWIL